MGGGVLKHSETQGWRGVDDGYGTQGCGITEGGSNQRKWGVILSQGVVKSSRRGYCQYLCTGTR
eukprot:70828-Hanusia_phi.AAC.1